MCDYSLHNVASRPAKVGDKLVSTQFPNAITRGFCDPSQPHVAVCLLPGTELAFEKEVERDASFRFLPARTASQGGSLPPGQPQSPGDAPRRARVPGWKDRSGH